MPFYERIDMPATAPLKNALKAVTPEKLGMKELAGDAVRAMRTTAPGNSQSFGGIKVETDMGWFAARPSGTEDVCKIYAESFRDAAHLKTDSERRAGGAGAAGLIASRLRKSRGEFHEGAQRRVDLAGRRHRRDAGRPCLAAVRPRGLPWSRCAPTACSMSPRPFRP